MRSDTATRDAASSDGGSPCRATRRRARTRERLLDAARTVLVRDGIQGASVEHICDVAGFTRGAFYSNFSSKDELVLALFHREREALFARMREAADPSAITGLDAAEAVSVIVERFLMFQPVDRDWYVVNAELELRGVRDDAVGREFNAAWREVTAEFTAFLETVVAALGLRLAVPARHVSMVLIGTYDTALRDALVEDRPIDTELLTATLPAILLSVAHPRD